MNGFRLRRAGRTENDFRAKGAGRFGNHSLPPSRPHDNAKTPHEYSYIREKVFTEVGRKYADVEIPFLEKDENIRNLRARTIHADGTIVEFDGNVYVKEIVKARGFKYLAKTFTLSDVQPGSIIEYQYIVDFREDYVFNSHWILSQELFTKRARFSLKRYPQFILRWTWPNGLPAGSTIPIKEGDTIRLESQDIPALEIEEDMPPLDSIRFRVDFIYGLGNPEKDPDKFWQTEGKRYNDEVEKFVDKRGSMQEALAHIISPGDTPELKLQKIYARVGPARDTDTFEIAIPAGYEVDDLPPPINAEYSFASYHSKTEVSGNTLKYTRTFEVKELSVPVSKADDLKRLYRIIAGDERNTAVLKPVGQ
jgi:hypothetical protein